MHIIGERVRRIFNEKKDKNLPSLINGASSLTTSKDSADEVTSNADAAIRCNVKLARRFFFLLGCDADNFVSSPFRLSASAVSKRAPDADKNASSLASTLVCPESARTTVDP
jgi:hypothetical protein